MTRRLLLEWAAEEASRYLEPLGDRYDHTRAVATTAGRLAVALPEEDRELFVAAACLHDIGYAPALAVTGFHPLDGARYVADHGHHELAGLVAHHTGARHEAAIRGFGSELAAFTRDEGPVAALLTFCDLTNVPQGQSMTAQRRIVDVADRYGLTHPVTRGLLTGWDELCDQVATAQHLRARHWYEVGLQQAAKGGASNGPAGGA